MCIEAEAASPLSRCGPGEQAGETNSVCTCLNAMQVGLCYQLGFNGEKFSSVVEARTLINHAIGEWLRHHKIIHSTSVQPLYNFTGSS